jgi:hypothetical protein
MISLTFTADEALFNHPMWGHKEKDDASTVDTIDGESVSQYSFVNRRLIPSHVFAFSSHLAFAREEAFRVP